MTPFEKIVFDIVRSPRDEGGVSGLAAGVALIYVS
jgi:hypothetical protein